MLRADHRQMEPTQTQVRLTDLYAESLECLQPFVSYASELQEYELLIYELLCFREEMTPFMN